MLFSPVTQITTHDVVEVADALHVSVATIYTRLCRDPESLPPVLNIKGSSKLIFCNLHQWLQERMSRPLVAVPTVLSEAATETIAKKRGRPSNASRKAAAEIAKVNGGAA